jgi:ankyrin repeat protein
MKKSRNIIITSCLLSLFGSSSQVFASGGNQWGKRIVTVPGLVERFGANLTADQLLKHLRVRDGNGNTLLHRMIPFPNSANLLRDLAGVLSLDQLLEVLKMRDNCGNTSLHVAAMYISGSVFLWELADILSRDQLLRLLIEEDEFGNTPLHVAATCDEDGLAFLRTLSEIFPRNLLFVSRALLDLLQKPNQLGNTFLHMALQSDFGVAFFRELTRIFRGPALQLLEIKGYSGNTPLHMAVNSSTGAEVFRELAGILLQDQMIGPDILWGLLHEQNELGDTPLHLAKGPNGVQFAFEVSKFLSPDALMKLLVIENDDGNTPFHMAANDDGSAFPLAFIFKLSPLQFAELATIATNHRGLTPLQVAYAIRNEGFIWSISTGLRRWTENTSSE